MRTKSDVVFDVHGNAVSADILVCEHCAGEVWVCFVVEGQTHSHFQCVECGISYCPNGHCT